MSGLVLLLLLLEVDSIASLFTAIPLPHVEQNFATSSILDPHEAQNSYIPPIILLPLPYHMLLYFRYSLKGPCVRYNSELYLTQGGITFYQIRSANSGWSMNGLRLPCHFWMTLLRFLSISSTGSCLCHSSRTESLP